MGLREGRRLRVHGLVQGVGFRWSMVEQAQRLGLGGWVRNRHDGTVEALVCGPHAALAAIIHWTGKGPSGARVTQLEVEALEDAELAACEGAFGQRPSA